MKYQNKIVAILLVVCMASVMLTGCSSAAEGNVLYDAIVKSQSIRSCQNDIQFALRIDASGLSEENKAGFEQLKAALNNMQLAMNMKQKTNEDNTVTLAQADINMTLGGVQMPMSVWVDMDLNGTTPKFKEIIKLPPILTYMDPSMAGKEYMVMDLSSAFAGQNTQDAAQPINADMLKLTKELQAKAMDFTAKYLAQYNPGLELITAAGTRDINTPEGTVKTRVYNIKLDDSTAKKLARYTVTNFANNKDAEEFMIEYMRFIEKFAAMTPGAEESMADFSKLIAEYEKEKPAALEKINKMMDKLEDVKLIGDNGIFIEFAVDEKGFIVSLSGSMDFVIDVAKLNAVMEEKAEKPADNAVYNIGFDFNTVIYNINKELSIELPEVTPQNSIGYNDILQSMTPVQAEVPSGE